MEETSIVVPVRGASPALRRCLERIQSLDPEPLEVLVVNDGADPLVREWCRRRGLRCLETEIARGPAAARNLGAAQASGSLLLFIDSDVLAPFDAVRQVEEAFFENPHLSALFGSYDDSPTEPGFFSRFKNLFHHFTHQNGARRAETFWAGLGAIRRDVLFVMGGFDPRYVQPSVEDIELGYRMRARDFEIELRPELQGKHMKRWTLASVFRTDFFQRAIPWTDLLWRHPERKADLYLRPRELLSAFVALSFVPLLIAAGGKLGLIWWALPLMPLWIALNWPLYSLFFRRAGPWFAAAAVAWHWFYFIYAALGFAVGTIRHWTRRMFAGEILLREVSA